MKLFSALPYAMRMAATVGADVDGTFLDYGHKWQEDRPHLLNHTLCAAQAAETNDLLEKTLALVQIAVLTDDEAWEESQ